MSNPKAVSRKEPKDEPADDEEEDKLTLCGLGSWHPAWLQSWFASPLAFLVNLCAVNVCHLMAANLFYASMSTLEKRFAYNSQVSSVIMLSDCILPTLLSPIVGYYAIRFHRARLIAITEVTVGLACFITCLPYLIYGAASEETLLLSQVTNGSSSSSSSFEMCPSQEATCSFDDSSSSSNTVWPAVALLLLGNLIRGNGFMIYYTVAMPFIDDSIPKRNAPFFLSIMHGVNILGRLAAFALASYTLRFSENPWQASGGRLEPSDPRFIGAWWLGYALAGILIILTSLPLFLFPRQFRTATVKTSQIEERLAEGKVSFLKSVYLFFTNPLVMLFFFGNVFRYIGMDGFYAFMSKYFEAQYRTSSSQASLITGSIGFAPITLGLILGGGFISLFKPRARLLFSLVFLAELVSVLTIGSGLILGCKSVHLEGTDGAGKFNLDSLACSRDCHCSSRSFSPLCGADGPNGGVTYFSPCQAGCSAFNESISTFTNCSCSPEVPLTPGYCASDLTCTNLLPYLLLLATGTLISSSAVPGNALITFRSVDPIEKTFTSGLLGSLIPVLAFIPGELLYGYLVDSTCLVWESKCGKRGNCWLYDTDAFRRIFIGVTVAFLAVGSLFDFLIIFFADGMKSLYDDDDENKAVVTKKINLKEAEL